MKLWDKGVKPDSSIIEFTAGKDRETDLQIAGWDIVGSMAHVLMLHKVGLLSEDERDLLMTGLHSLFTRHQNGFLIIDKGIEDIHSQVEKELSDLHGPAGKKVHTARSRNDQVLVDIRMFTRAGIDKTAHKVNNLVNKLLSLSDQHSSVLLPGYTHFQPAMLSTFGLWFGSFAEALTDDLVVLSAARTINNRNPLGTAAGYGSTLEIDRQYTTELLEFDSMVYNSAYAALNRGKVELAVAGAMASVASTLAKLSMDVCIFMSAEFRFVSFPDELITGSSIMPQKKNPDVFEIIRARSNALMALPNEISLLINNLPSGYNRDLQLLKSRVFDAFRELDDCLDILHFMLGNIKVRQDILDNPFYDQIFSTEEVNRLVKKGVPFREAYLTVAGMLKEGNFPRTTLSDYSHHGSIGNLCNEEIRKRSGELAGLFNSTSLAELEKKLLDLI
ncbi:MAG: argininosuccinate lyase [Bacteroidales bacterium]